MSASSRPGDDPLRSLLRVSHHLPAHRFGVVVQQHGRMLGAEETVVYLTDYEQSSLVAVQGDGVPQRGNLSIDESVGGLAYRRVTVARSPDDASGTTRLWAPLLDGSERVGVLEFLFTGPVSEETERETRDFASLLAELAITRDAYSDVFSRLRRNRELTVAAQIQWELLPPLTFSDERVLISGVLEPSYEIGGDTFDYAVNGDTAELLVLDAVGHGLPAALLATAALGAYRAARRHGRPLADVAAQMDEVIAGQFSGSAFATALVARLDLPSGRLSWVNAGHPPPLVLRAGALVELDWCAPSRPLGLQGAPAEVCEAHLRPGDRLLLYTDGIVEARSPAGEFFGEELLADLVLRAESAGDPPPETLRRLMRSVLDHQAGRLQDDASVVLVEWRTGAEARLVV